MGPLVRRPPRFERLQMLDTMISSLVHRGFVQTFFTIYVTVIVKFSWLCFIVQMTVYRKYFLVNKRLMKCACAEFNNISNKLLTVMCCVTIFKLIIAFMKRFTTHNVTIFQEVEIENNLHICWENSSERVKCYINEVYTSLGHHSMNIWETSFLFSRLFPSSTWCFPSNPRSDPPKTIIQPISCEGGAGLDVPVMILDTMKRKCISNLSRCHCILEVLFVGEN